MRGGWENADGCSSGLVWQGELCKFGFNGLRRRGKNRIDLDFRWVTAGYLATGNDQAGQEYESQ
jgi:hypothetical protein